MNMKTNSAIAILGLSLMLALPAQARDKHHYGDHHGFRDYAKVIDVQPVFRTVSVEQPARECWKEDVRHPVKRHVRGQDEAAGTLAGGLIGGAIGHHLGGDDPGAVIAGTLIGAAIGHDAARQQPRPAREYYISQETRCNHYTEYREVKQQDGYTVSYRYRGEVFTTHMNHHPGKRIRIRVRIEPIDD